MSLTDHRNDSYLSAESLTAPRVNGITTEETQAVQDLIDVWHAHIPSNRRRSIYFQARENLDDLGIAIPDKVRAQARPVVGWPEKAVRTLADMSTFEGFSTPPDDPDGIAALSERNGLDVLVPETIVSAYTHSCAFWTVSRRSDGSMAIAPHAAGWSSAIWDYENRRIGSALTIDAKDKRAQVTQFTVWLPDWVITYRRTGGVWSAVRQPTLIGRAPVAAFAYDAQLDRPFGRSRITRPLMNLTDIAYRTIVRMETTAEFYSAPRIWFLGLSDEMFNSIKSASKQQRWSSLISAINGTNADPNGGVPQLHQIEQASMTPHSEMLKTIAMMAASETDLPPTDMGITLSNPTSAEAMAEAERKLSRTADRQNKRFGHALKDLLSMALEMRDGITADQAFTRLADVHALWAPTKEVSDAARADYYTKIASVNQGFADSSVGLRKAGLSEDELQSFRLDEQNARAQQLIDQLRLQTNTPPQQEGQVNNGESTDNA